MPRQKHIAMRGTGAPLAAQRSGAVVKATNAAPRRVVAPASARKTKSFTSKAEAFFSKNGFAGYTAVLSGVDNGKTVFTMIPKATVVVVNSRLRAATRCESPRVARSGPSALLALRTAAPRGA